MYMNIYMRYIYEEYFSNQFLFQNKESAFVLALSNFLDLIKKLN